MNLTPIRAGEMLTEEPKMIEMLCGFWDRKVGFRRLSARNRLSLGDT